MALDVSQVFVWMDQQGFLDSLLPFFLFFTIIYAFLEKVNIFGAEEAEARKFNVIISLIIALLVVIPHVAGIYPPGKDVVDIVNKSIPGIVLWTVIIFAVYLLLAPTGIMPKISQKLELWVVLLAAIVVGMIFAVNTGFVPPNVLGWLSSQSENLQVLAFIAGVALILYYLITPSSPAGEAETGSGEGQ